MYDQHPAKTADELIRKVVSRYNNLYSPSGEVHDIELDLLLEELRQLYDAFKKLSHIKPTPVAVVEKPKPNPEPQPEPVQEQPAPPVLAKEPQMPVAEIVEPQPEEVENVTADMDFIENQDIEIEKHVEADPEKVVEPEIEPEAAVNAENKAATLADKFQQEHKPLSETIGEKTENSVIGSRILSPISDMASAISLNDRFSFISELFDHNAELYDEAITRVNRAVNYDEANWIFQKYYKPHWSDKYETYQLLQSFIKRRFV